MCNIQYISLLLFVFFIKIKAQQHNKQNCQQKKHEHRVTELFKKCNINKLLASFLLSANSSSEQI